MAVVIGSVIVFPVVIVALTLALLAAETRLKPKGKVKITINGDPEKAIETDAGDTLLSTLSSAGVMLPSACGGGGTCGVCKCQVTAGGGDIAPTELSHVSYRESKENWRLSCQVKVREDMEIVVPDEVFSINKWECEVIGNKSVATYIREFTLKLPEGENPRTSSRAVTSRSTCRQYQNLKFKDFQIEEEYHPDWDAATTSWKYVANNDERRAVARLLDGQPPGRGQHRDAQHPHRDPAGGPREAGVHERHARASASSYVFDLQGRATR